MTTVHVVEPGGRGGVYQHAASLAGALAAAGVPVVLHTAADAEDVRLGRDVAYHDCFWRFRRVRPRPLRRAAVAAGWLLGGVPSCARRFRRGDVVDIEGWFWPGLLVPLALAARWRGCRLSLSPHLTFSRRGRAGEERTMRWLARRADVVFLFSERDRLKAAEWGVDAVPAPLLLPPHEPDPALVDAWRQRWGAGEGRRVALLAGQLRADKGIDVALEAASRWPSDLLLAVVGEDTGGLEDARRLARRLGVRMEVDEGYQPLDRFVAALAAADVVICPYRVSSQSAVLAMAVALGRPSVASDVGGLPELATVTVPVDDAAALAAAVEDMLAAGIVRPPSPAGRDGPRGVQTYLEAFGLVEACRSLR